jgi:hypothetical protein
MNFHDMSDGIRLSHHAHGAPVPSVDSLHAAIDTGDNSAGNGGDGYFFGSLVNAPIVIYMPINIAVGGYNSTANADQSNTVQIDQSATQIAGVGGDGGNDNASIGGSVTASGTGGGDSGAISTGGNQAGNGGDGFFLGSIINASFVLYHPINIAVAGPNSSAHADQTNNVNIDQSAIQIAGNGATVVTTTLQRVGTSPPRPGPAPTWSVPAIIAPATVATGTSSGRWCMLPS